MTESTDDRCRLCGTVAYSVNTTKLCRKHYAMWTQSTEMERVKRIGKVEGDGATPTPRQMVAFVDFLNRIRAEEQNQPKSEEES